MKSAVLWRGRSKIDGRAIVVVATRSTNPKTGDQLQTWILVDRVLPSRAIKTGADRAICGDCAARGVADGARAKGRTCYVNVAFAPNAVWRAMKRRAYRRATTLAELRALAGGLDVRLGAYGDPAAVPVRVWRRLLAASGTGRWTGYTHQWRRPMAAPLREIAMASADSPADAIDAARAGWRSFLVQSPGAETPAGAISCPASAEAGRRTTCAKCALCAGASERTARAPNVAIHAHGGLGFAERFARRAAAVIA